MEEKQIADILKRTGARPAPPDDVAAQVKAEVREVWRQEVEQVRRRSAARRWYALAASIVGAVALGWLVLQPNPAPATAMSVVRVVNDVQYLDGGTWRALHDGDALARPATLRTSENGLVALRTQAGADIRVASSSDLAFDADAVTLEHGAVYVDTGAAPQAVSIRTPFGVARDIGTRFEVRVEPTQWRVQVRDGSVVVDDDDVRETAGAGRRLVIDADNLVERTEVSSWDESWLWTQRAAGTLEIEGASLHDYLDWVGRETGRQVSYADSIIEREAKRTILHGSIDGLTPRESLSSVLATTDYRLAESNSGVIMIDR